MTLRGERDGVALRRANAPLRVLVVADPSTDAHRAVKLLEGRFPQAQLEVEIAGGLQAAQSRLRGRHVDVILVDAGERAPGATVAEALRTAHPDTPLMVLTGSIDGQVDLWARVDGADDARPPSAPGMATAIVNALQGNLAEDRAHRYLELARGLLDALDAPTCAVDAEGRIVAVNLAWRDVTRQNGGMDERSGVGVSYLDVCDGSDQSRYGSWTPDAATVAAGMRQVLAGELELFRHDYACHSPHENRWCSVQMTPATINGGRGAVVTHLDTTNMREIEQTLAYRSMHDALTDLPNRSLLVDRLEQAIADAERRGLGVAVAHVDLSGFQRVNDTLQYSGGDRVLVEVAERLQGQLRPGDTVARASGDEFLVLWRDLDVDDPGAALALGERLLEALEQPFGPAHRPVSLSADVGVARHVVGWGADRTLSSAVLALAEAKTRGPGTVALYTQELEAAVVGRTTLESELRTALAGTVSQFVLHYQPVVDLRSGEVVAVESLVRWQHPVLGLVPPDRFIPMAEATGLIHPLGGWVLDQAVRDAGNLTYDGRELYVAVNFSVLQLNDEAVLQVRQVLESSGLTPGRLILEVTESALVQDEDAVVRALEALAQLGVHVAIDDFGTGYSSLHYLRRYPINIIKIDREFVAGIGTSVDDEAICESIVHLAEAVGAMTVAEGVETPEQYAFLRSLGCHHGQGFLWSPPVPAERLPAALAACGEVPVPSTTSPPTPARHPTDKHQQDAQAGGALHHD
ncbi:putative bifunctional diguanylate cyclase/phosphodiesterase [Aeromicrobium chenweiae]|uniref:Uncharacterized protein n=1 Tax=Aeromicrobium chenweiae TaxID=2079793 RepID=A0A2S0WM10_9ACTN|nr:EAL domain-containing protein [Aeromicrobium chenweiae]AWB92304.1 hypothetical protein C3E78_08885 [Aeromicrobium chenweiae]TGN31410.1 GGDEF domain-containing response regulator [Aeromicrobium chenweiae]